MKDQEERELNGEMTPNAQGSPDNTVKPAEETSGEERASKSDASAEEHGDAPHSVVTEGNNAEGTADNSLQGKESLPCDTAQGALGQVKAKVEVCKDESIGKNYSL